MSSKYHASKQGRTHGRYRERLRDRGLNRAPKMPEVEHLRKKQGWPKRSTEEKRALDRKLDRMLTEALSE